jgi:hypothetical protein
MVSRRKKWRRERKSSALRAAKEEMVSRRKKRKGGRKRSALSTKVRSCVEVEVSDTGRLLLVSEVGCEAGRGEREQQKHEGKGEDGLCQFCVPKGLRKPSWPAAF